MKHIVLCGGSGTRLWPLSREHYPKQFLQLFPSHSLFQKTVLRNLPLCDARLIVTNTEHYYLALHQLHALACENNRFLLETTGRNTAAAAAFACLDTAPDELVLITPADHLVKRTDQYEQTVREASEWAKQGYLVTFGAMPTHAETGYGYIQTVGSDVISFREKPDLPTAETYLAAGNWYWNCGILLCKAGVFLQELQTWAPQVYAATKEAYEQSSAKEPRVFNRDQMMQIPEISLDRAVLEQSKNVKMVPADMGWSDLGSFDALAKELEKDASGNTSHRLLVGLGAENNLVLSDRLVAVIDVRDLLIVDTPDALLVSQKGASAKLKEVVAQLRREHPHVTNVHLTAYRPWGTYTVLEEANRYKIKRLVVKPGGRLSLQKHYHRSEHWVVVSGTAKVTVGNTEKLVLPNQSTYIEVGEVHRLENPGKIDLVLIEVQVGDYLEEDDIFRLVDEYERP